MKKRQLITITREMFIISPLKIINASKSCFKTISTNSKLLLFHSFSLFCLYVASDLPLFLFLLMKIAVLFVIIKMSYPHVLKIAILNKFISCFPDYFNIVKRLPVSCVYL